MQTTTRPTLPRLVLGVLLAALLGTALYVAPATAAAPTLRSCGNLEAGGLLVGDITTKRVGCVAARRVVRAAVVACERGGSCQARGYSCLTARATSELTFARCSRARGSSELYEVIRFDYGS